MGSSFLAARSSLALLLLSLLATDGSASIGHYISVVDAGSSGSRIFLYHVVGGSGSEPPRMEPVKDSSGQVLQKKEKPGLSSFADDPAGAVASVKKLMDFVEPHVPSHAGQVPLHVYGTAGLRVVPAAKRATMFDAIVAGVDARGPLFQLHRDNIRVISGEEEGMFAWLTINYAENRLKGEF